MSHFDYETSKHLMRGDPPFNALIMAAMRKADSFNMDRLRDSFPEVYTELMERYNAPAGLLPHELQEGNIRARVTINPDQMKGAEDGFGGSDYDYSEINPDVDG